MIETPAVRNIDRRLPAGDEIFLDHVGHFVADADSAARALVQAGFAPTPPSVQVSPDPGGGPPQKTGTGNVTAMLDRGYIEFLFKTADTPLAQQFEAAMARYRGLHLAAFAVADAATTHARLAKAGFRLQPVVDMRRPVGTAEGEDIAAFSIVRPAPGEMPEGRIQALTHRTEHTVWQQRWLSHPNGATALLDVVIAEGDVSEAANRFQRFLGRAAAFDRYGQSVTLDRGRVQLVSSIMLNRLFPGLEIPALPFICSYGVAVRSLSEAAACLAAGSISFDRQQDCVIAPFPAPLGTGCWAFVEHADALPWRRP
jgi:glyoxalase-like protein